MKSLCSSHRRPVLFTLLITATLAQSTMIGQTQDRSEANATVCSEQTCEHTYLNGTLYLKTSQSGIDVQVSEPIESKQHEVVSVKIKNSTNASFDVIPPRFVMYAKDDKDRVLPYVEPVEAINRELGPLPKDCELVPEDNQPISNSVADIKEARRKNSTASLSNSLCRLSKQRNASQQSSGKSRDERFQELQAKSLRANTIAPGDEIKGIVFFRRAKSDGIFILTLNLGNRVFTFELTPRNRN